jgi:hypothetical protein
MHQASVTLRPHVREVSRARHRVARFCGGLPEDLTSIAQVLTSELVTTAVQQRDAEAVHVQLTLARSGLRVEVTDRCCPRSMARECTARSERGPSLMLVERMASTWGIQPNCNGPGSTVWFTLRTT